MGRPLARLKRNQRDSAVPPPFEERLTLIQVCALDYTVSQTSRLIFWASDMLHRLFHLPSIGRGYIEHYTAGWCGAIEAAAQGNPNVTHDSDVLQYYALEAYAYDIAVPGEGCPGPQNIKMESS